MVTKKLFGTVFALSLVAMAPGVMGMEGEGQSNQSTTPSRWQVVKDCVMYAASHKLNLTVGTIATSAVSLTVLGLSWNHGWSLLKSGIKTCGSCFKSYPIITGAVSIVGLIGGAIGVNAVKAKIKAAPVKALEGINWVGENITKAVLWGYKKLFGGNQEYTAI